MVTTAGGKSAATASGTATMTVTVARAAMGMAETTGTVIAMTESTSRK